MSLLARVRLYEYEAGNAREVHCLLKKKKKTVDWNRKYAPYPKALLD